MIWPPNRQRFLSFQIRAPNCINGSHVTVVFFFWRIELDINLSIVLSTV